MHDQYATGEQNTIPAPMSFVQACNARQGK